MRKIFFLTLAFFSLMFVSCEKEPIISSEGAITINNNRSQLNSRVTIRDTEVFNSGTTLKSTDSEYQIILRAEVGSPYIGEHQLQASHIKLSGNHAYVTYNTQGASYRGGAEIFNVVAIKAPTIISQALISDTELTSIDVDPKGVGLNNFVYVVGAYNPDANYLENGPAVIEKLIVNQANQFVHLDSPRQFYDLPGYMANDVRYDSQTIYATSGSNGGLTVLNNGMNLKDEHPLEYTRSVDIGNYLVVYSVTEGLIVYNAKNGKEIRRISTGGDHFTEAGKYLEAKSMVRLYDDLAFVSVGNGGVEVYDLSNGNHVHTIPVPEGYVSNGVSVTDDLILIANGSAGIQVIDRKTYEVLGSFTLNGSANFVSAKCNKLFVATGLSGLNVLEIVKK
jgi:hypothetical protein